MVIVRSLGGVNLTNFVRYLNPGVKVTLDLLNKESIVWIAAFTLLYLKINDISCTRSCKLTKLLKNEKLVFILYFPFKHI